MLEPLPFADGTFDAVMINQVLHHLDTPNEYSGSAIRARSHQAAVFFHLRNLTHRAETDFTFSMKTF